MEPGSSRSISIGHLIALNDEMRALVAAGVPLDRGLLAVGRDLRGRLGPLATRLGARLEAGEDLTRALEAEGQAVPAFYRSVVEAGLRSGRLTQAMEGLAIYARHFAETRRSIGLALVYPAMVTVLTYAFFVGFVIAVVPRLLSAFETFRFGASRPLEALRWLNENMVLWVPIGPVVFLLLGLWWFWSGRATSLRPGLLNGVFRIVPGLGSIFRLAQAADFAGLLALLVEHGVGLETAIPLAADASGSPRLRTTAHAIAEGLARGESLGDLARAHPGLPPMLAWVLSTSKAQGALGPALAQTSATYRARAENGADRLQMILPSVILVAIGLLAGVGFLFTVFQPLILLWQELASPFPTDPRQDQPEAMPPMSDHAEPTDDLELLPEPEPDDGTSGSRRTLSATEAADFAGHLVAITRTGLPLPDGLRALGGELDRGRLRSLMIATADQLERGQPLDGALGGLARRFPPHLRGLIVAGSRSGTLAESLGQYVRYSKLGSELRRRFWMSVGYPAFLFVAMVALVGFVSFWVIEVFERILQEFRYETPGITILLFLIGRVIRERGLAALEILASVGAVGFLIFRFTISPPVRRSVLQSLPAFGPILRSSTLAEYCHIVAVLVEGQMPLPRALVLSGEGVGDAKLARVGVSVQRAVESGQTLSNALAVWSDCPAGLIEVLEGSEARGDLPEALHMAGDMFEARAKAQASFVTFVFAALTMIFVVWGIGFILVALYLPIINLITKLAG